MSELFSKDRIIDYFIIFETVLEGIDQITHSDIIKKNPNGTLTNLKAPITIQYEYRTINQIPKINYKKIDPDFYSLNVDSILNLLPNERGYLVKRKESFFSMMFTNELGTHYFGHFLKIYFPVDPSNSVYQKFPDLKENNIKIYVPKYLCFMSLHPYFISFKNLLTELYDQSCLNEGKCYRVENILNNILFRMNLPKYETTQLLFSLSENVYTFSNAPFRNEISFRLLFSYISIKNIVMIIISIMMHSIIVIIHSNMETIVPLMHSLFELIYPFKSTYSIVSNLNPNKIELLGSFSGAIFGIYRKDFKDIDEVINANNSNYVILDLSKNKLNIEHNEYFQGKFPIARIKKLIKDLSSFADIYPSHTIKEIENGEASVWSTFESRNMDVFEQYSSYNKINFRSKNVLFGKKIGNEDKFDDFLIRGMFFDFFLGLFEKYDEKKHYVIINEVTQDKTFDKEKFIKESSSDIQPFLEYLIEQPTFDIFIQNVNHIVDQKHKTELKKLSYKYGNLEIKINPEIREKSLIPNFESTYKIFMIGLERRKNKKSLDYLFRNKIYHSITICSPQYETLPYTQVNIFSDPIYEDLIKYKRSVIYDKTKIEFGLLHLSLDEQKGLISSLLLKEYNDLINTKVTKANNDKTVKLNEILTRISTELIQEQKTEPIIVEYKELLIKYSKMVKKFYGITPQEIKNYLMKQTRNSIGIKKLENKRPGQKISKKSYIESSITLKKSYMSKDGENTYIDFRINFGINMISSVAYCDYCSRPNNIWDARREFEYRQVKKTTITKCKFCLQNFVPCFYILEEEEKGSTNPAIMKLNSLTNSATPFQYYKTKSVRKVEYMCYDHLIDSYTDYLDSGDEKFPYDLFYNICVMFGEVNCFTENKEYLVKMETLEVFISNYFLAHPEAKSNYLRRDTATNTIKSATPTGRACNIKTNKTFKTKSNFGMSSENMTKILKTERNTSKKPTKRKSKNHKEAQMTVRFSLNDLIDDSKYSAFQKDMLKINAMNKVQNEHNNGNSIIGQNNQSSNTNTLLMTPTSQKHKNYIATETKANFSNYHGKKIEVAITKSREPKHHQEVKKKVKFSY